MEGDVVDYSFDIKEQVTGIFDYSLFILREIGVVNERWGSEMSQR